MISRSHLPLIPATLLALFVVLFAAQPAGGQATTDRSSVVGQAAESPLAVPFVGSFDVWCTSGNPAPGNLCGTHHSTPAIDFGMDPGTPINATGDGVVSEIETNCVGFGFCRNGAGNFIAIEHADGKFSRYLHLTDVFVEQGATVNVGDVIGTTGVTGQSSSPHLHYDTQFPRGTRVDSGTWIGCVDGEQVLYPDSFGVDNWNDVPFGTVMRNDDYNCLAGATTQATPPQSPQPIIASGDGVFAIAAPDLPGSTSFEARVTADGEQRLYNVSASAFTIVEDPGVPVQIEIRPLDATQSFSDPATYDGSTVPSAHTCNLLHATSDLLGTARYQADLRWRARGCMCVPRVRSNRRRSPGRRTTVSRRVDGSRSVPGHRDLRRS